MPAKAGIQATAVHWIPAFAGMTVSTVLCGNDGHRYPRSNGPNATFAPSFTIVQ